MKLRPYVYVVFPLCVGVYFPPDFSMARRDAIVLRPVSPMGVFFVCVLRPVFRGVRVFLACILRTQ